jgi:ATP-dependent helicase HrpB
MTRHQSLPVDAALPRLLAALDAGAAAVLVAPPGAGKTTRVPLALLDRPWARGGRVVMLEPRRLAARAAADFMARGLGERVGETVGLRVRMDSRVGPRTRVEVMTEGVLTRLILADPALEGVACVIFDEFHERSLDADLGLALALDAQAALRPDLRVLVMSATIDGARVAGLLGGAPVIESAGRLHPVETRYLGRDPGRPIAPQVAEAVLAALGREAGSILAFLPGAGEIRRTEAILRERIADPAVDLAPLYGALDPAAQDRAIAPAPAGRRKVVLATSIAETSLTIEGVRVVVDGGLARVPRYDPATGLTGLATVRVSRAAADQRRGRAGRLGPGVCYRLWDEAEDRGLAPFAPPEILAADLAPLALALAEWGVPDPASLKFLDLPPPGAFAAARALLRGLEALDAQGRLTDEGRALARMPLPPRLGHMLRRAARRGQGRLAAWIAAILAEHGLGGRDVDLRQRLARFMADRGERAAAARGMAEAWRRLASGGGDGEPADRARAGAVLALAFPDRIAQARPGRAGEFLLASGRGGVLDPADPLAREPYLAVADLAGGGPSARILLAAPLAVGDIEEDFAAAIVAAEEVGFDPQTASVRARQVRRLGQIVLSERPLARVDPDRLRAALLAGVRRLGLSCLPWSEEQRLLRARVAFLRTGEPEAWPDLSDAALAASLEAWLGPFVAGKRALAEIGAGDLAAALDALLSWDLRRRLDAEAPAHFVAPTGTRLAIDYAAEGGPAVAVRVQELFGLAAHPTLGRRRVPLTLRLLSPAHRPVQVTRDLPGFWAGSYQAVRAAMKGRYPKHPWPEDPLAAPPTRRAKPRA